MAAWKRMHLKWTCRLCVFHHTDGAGLLCVLAAGMSDLPRTSDSTALVLP
jgi:hypothetical protein